MDAIPAIRIDSQEQSQGSKDVDEGVALYGTGGFQYDRWVQKTGAPIYRGYYIKDLRTLELGWWADRGCDTAFIQLYGQEGVSEARVSEIPPAEALPPVRLAVDELVYVLSGSGSTTIGDDSGDQRSFEWRAKSLFLLHHGTRYRHFNTESETPARMLHFNYLPIAMSAVPDIEVLTNFEDFAKDESRKDFTAARVAKVENQLRNGDGTFWYGDFFWDMGVWDQLTPSERRGAGGKVVYLGFPGSEMTSHMSVFPALTYKKAHRHGPGRSIVIPAGEGFSVFWEEGDEKLVIPWHEASLLTPPNKWFHQHFNLGDAPARYLALHPLRQFSGHAEKVQDRAADEIDYSDEEPWIRTKFEEELAKRGLKSAMS